MRAGRGGRVRTNHGGRDLKKRKGNLGLNEKPQLQGDTQTPLPGC